MAFVAKEMFLTRGVGRHREKLASFELAGKEPPAAVKNGDQKIKKGETGTEITQSAFDYFKHEVTNGPTVYPIANATVYRNDDGTGAQTTEYTYSWFSNSAQMESMTVERPIVTTDQNGPGGSTRDTDITFFDSYGRMIWHKDAENHLTYTAYDPLTGAVVKTITDVDTDLTSDFTGLPSGCSSARAAAMPRTRRLSAMTSMPSASGPWVLRKSFRTSRCTQAIGGQRSGAGSATNVPRRWRRESTRRCTRSCIARLAWYQTNSVPVTLAIADSTE